MILDSQQFANTGSARSVNEIVAKLFQRAWRQENTPQSLGWMNVVSDPASASDILNRPDAFPKCYSFLTELGHSRFDAHGSAWEHRRDLTQPSYRHAAQTNNRATLEAIYSHWLTGEAIEHGRVSRALLAAATTVFFHALGGTSDSGPIADWLISLRETAALAQHIAMFQPNQVQIDQTRLAVTQLRKDLRELLHEDKALVAKLGTRAHKFNTEIDILGEITVNLFAGTETTVASISWALHALARHPRAQEKIALEIQEYGPNSPTLNHFIQETMRYFPPVPLLVRTVANFGETIAGRPVEKGTMVALSVVGLHHHHEYWQTPETFNPSRTEFVNSSYNRRAYLPFSAGPRVCGGIGLARAEIAIALSQILARYRLEPDLTPIRYEFSLTLRPANTSNLKFTPSHI